MKLIVRYRITCANFHLSPSTRRFVPELPTLTPEHGSLWYISRTTRGHTLQDCFTSGLFLDRGDTQLSISWEGDTAYLMPRFGDEASQSWFFRKTSQGCYSISPVIGEGALGIAANINSSENRQVVLQRQSSSLWKLEPYRLSIPTGNKWSTSDYLVMLMS